MKLMKKIIRWLSVHIWIVKWARYLLNVISFIILIIWAKESVIEAYFHIEFTIDLEATLGIITIVLLGLGNLLASLLDEAEFSPAHALAFGYVNNFIFPAVTQLMEDGDKKPKICIYRPEHFDELSSTNVDRVKAELQNKNYQLTIIQLVFKHARAKDLLTLHRNGKLRTYFDFPNTLLSLYAYVDYKVRNNGNSHDSKNKLIAKLIEEFYLKIDELFKEKGIDSYIKYCNKSLGGL